MKVLIFGGAGQLGSELMRRAHDLRFTVVAPVASEVDIADEETVSRLTRQVSPQVVINSAAYTAVDKAEGERDEAFRVNTCGAQVSAEAARQCGARYVYYSTDYVFDGAGQERPLVESDPTNPCNVYGASKLAGEEVVRAICGDDALILRTASLHGFRGESFVSTMIRLFGEREEVRVVDDQWSSPTWAGWLAEATIDLLRRHASGTFHAASRNGVSWFDFASEIRRLVIAAGAPCVTTKLTPISAVELARPAKRPRYSVLDVARIEEALNREALTWEEGLRCHLRERFPGAVL